MKEICGVPIIYDQPNANGHIIKKGSITFGDPKKIPVFSHAGEMVGSIKNIDKDGEVTIKLNKALELSDVSKSLSIAYVINEKEVLKDGTTLIKDLDLKYATFDNMRNGGRKWK